MKGLAPLHGTPILPLECADSCCGWPRRRARSRTDKWAPLFSMLRCSCGNGHDSVPASGAARGIRAGTATDEMMSRSQPVRRLRCAIVISQRTKRRPLVRPARTRLPLDFPERRHRKCESNLPLPQAPAAESHVAAWGLLRPSNRVRPMSILRPPRAIHRRTLIRRCALRPASAAFPPLCHPGRVIGLRLRWDAGKLPVPSDWN